jgi:hypothetical protein
MKGLAALAIVVMLGLSVYNWWEIRGLREDVQRLEAKVQQAQSGGVSEQAFQKAMDLLFQARVAMANTDWSKARNAYDSFSQQISAAANTAGHKASPALKWLENEAKDLRKQIERGVASR